MCFMNGLKRNTEKLFSHGGKLFAMAMDLPQCGLVEGLEDPLALIREVKDTELDALLVNVGVARLAQEELLHKKLLLRTSSGGTNLASAFTNVQKNHVSPETALAMGADAVVMMMVIGGADYASIQDAAAAIDAYHRLSIPVIVEILADDFSATQSFDIQANGARVAAELGADVVKAFIRKTLSRWWRIALCPSYWREGLRAAISWIPPGWPWGPAPGASASAGISSRARRSGSGSRPCPNC